MLLTVFTPTYNRAATLTRTYQSLKAQGFNDFEWLIVDDGSTDDTAALVESFQAEGALTIRYVRKDNGGKHTAYNVGLEQARGDLFFTVDSDDWLTADSLLTISRLYGRIAADSRCAGIIALKSFADQQIIGHPFRREDVLMSMRELELDGQGGERSIVFKTALARQFMFPVIAGERFMPEGVVYDRFAAYKFLISNVSLTVCEYQATGLSSAPKRLMLNNPGGYAIYFRDRIDMAAGLRERIGYALRYNAFRSMYRRKDIGPYAGSHRMMVGVLRIVNPLVCRFYKRDLE